MIIRNKEKDSREATAYRPEELDFYRAEAGAPSLEALEAGSLDFMAVLRQQRDEENAQFAVPERTFVEGGDVEKPKSQKVEKPVRLPSRGVSPWWLAAAVTVGFVIGFSMPRATEKPRDEATAMETDSLQGRSLATGDVNTALLVSL